MSSGFLWAQVSTSINASNFQFNFSDLSIHDQGHFSENTQLPGFNVSQRNSRVRKVNIHPSQRTVRALDLNGVAELTVATGNATFATAGSYTITYTATNDNDPAGCITTETTMATVAITVDPLVANLPSGITTNGGVTNVVRVPAGSIDPIIDMDATDPEGEVEGTGDGDQLDWSISGSDQVLFDIDDDGLITFNATPPPGMSNIDVRVANSDGLTDDTQNLSIMVFPDIDSDMGEVIDSDDLDDDNDGILDSVECSMGPPPARRSVQSDAVFYTDNCLQFFTVGNNTNGQGFAESGWEQTVTGLGGSIANDLNFTSTTFSNGRVSVIDDAVANPATTITSTTIGSFISGTTGSELLISPGNALTEPDGNIMHSATIAFVQGDLDGDHSF